MNDSAPGLSILQLRSSAGLYGADRMVLALDEGLHVDAHLLISQ